MAPFCLRCGAPVGDDDMRCTGCGADLDPCGTVPPPGPVGRASAKDAQPARAVRKRRLEPAASEDSLPARPARPGKRSKPKPTPPPQPAYPQPRQVRPAYPVPSPSLPPPVRPNEPVPTSPGFYHQAAPDPGRLAVPPPPPGANPQQGGPGVFRGLLIKMLGGNVDPPFATPNPYFMAMAPPGYPQPYPALGNPPPAHADGYWPPRSPQEPSSPEPPALDAPGRPSSPEHSEDDRQDRTQAIGGVDIDRLKMPKHWYSIQILDSHGEWRDWGPIPANGLNIGRAKNSADFPGLASMAVRHLRFGYNNGPLVVEDLGSLNGVYVRLAEPIELADGTRFRIGSHVIEFRGADPFEPEPPLRSEEDEEFYSRDLEPLGYLDLIRPNGRPGLRFPITKHTPTIIGREGERVDIALADDKRVSALHAQIRVDDGRIVLDDMKSRNGTFVHVLGSRPLRSGDVILAGRVLFRVVDSSSGLA
jgi:pSer/pThr/pTyr-binding forkhead associated (FHA) protein